jgi:ubiquinone/menaquinone biosynthesis C-methylase UbiE
VNNLQPIKKIMVCPACRGGLHIEQHGITCVDCKRVYPIHDSIPQFAIYKNNDAALKTVAEISNDNYERRYEDFEKAKNYNLKYDRKPLKRLSTLREYQILRRLLGGQQQCATMLEIPCGGGRISPQLVNATDMLIQADIGLGQILYGMTREKLGIPQIWMTASAFHIPLRDNSVDAVVCIRLSHHLPTFRQRKNLIIELLRVAGRYVVMTFFDYHSIKNILRRLRNSKPKLTMTLSQVSTVAARHGAKITACPRLSIIGSGHRYALMVKTPAL